MSDGRFRPPAVPVPSVYDPRRVTISEVSAFANSDVAEIRAWELEQERRRQQAAKTTAWTPPTIPVMRFVPPTASAPPAYPRPPPPPVQSQAQFLAPETVSPIQDSDVDYDAWRAAEEESRRTFHQPAAAAAAAPGQQRRLRIERASDQQFGSSLQQQARERIRSSHWQPRVEAGDETPPQLYGRGGRGRGRGRGVPPYYFPQEQPGMPTSATATTAPKLKIVRPVNPEEERARKEDEDARERARMEAEEREEEEQEKRRLQEEADRKLAEEIARKEAEEEERERAEKQRRIEELKKVMSAQREKELERAQKKKQEMEKRKKQSEADKKKRKQKQQLKAKPVAGTGAFEVLPDDDDGGGAGPDEVEEQEEEDDVEKEPEPEPKPKEPEPEVDEKDDGEDGEEETVEDEKVDEEASKKEEKKKKEKRAPVLESALPELAAKIRTILKTAPERKIRTNALPTEFFRKYGEPLQRGNWSWEKIASLMEGAAITGHKPKQCLTLVRLTQAEQTEEHVHRANAALGKGDWAAAKKALAAATSDEQVLLMRARACFGLGEHAACKKNCEAVLANALAAGNGDNTSAAHTWLARVELALGNIAEAKKHADVIRESKNRNAMEVVALVGTVETALAKSRELIEAGADPKKAAAEAQRVLEHCPGQQEAMLLKARACLAMERYGEVVALCKKTLARDACCADALVLCARAELRTDCPLDGPVGLLRQAAELRKGDESIAHLLAKASELWAAVDRAGKLAGEDRWSEAAEAFGQAMAVDPLAGGCQARMNRLLVQHFEALVSAGSTWEALAEADKVLALPEHREDARVIETRGDLRAKAGNHLGALEDLKRALGLTPKNHTEDVSRLHRKIRAEMAGEFRRERGIVDHYTVLQVERDANEAEIRKSYFRLALKYHPDKQPADVTAEQRAEAERVFKQVGEAYSVLSNEDARHKYDRTLDGEDDGSDDERRRRRQAAAFHRQTGRMYEDEEDEDEDEDEDEYDDDEEIPVDVYELFRFMFSRGGGHGFSSAPPPPNYSNRWDRRHAHSHGW